LVLQAGVMWVRKNDRTRDLFERWGMVWWLQGGADQGALLLAFRFCPVRLWLFGRPWNGGPAIRHHFGAAARR